jgi:polysaccharide pyruvyl transferase WcaK-like protein
MNRVPRAATTQSLAFIPSYLAVLVMIAIGATLVLISRRPHSSFILFVLTSYLLPSYMEKQAWIFSH